MASQWYSVISQKLFLAKTLSELAESFESNTCERHPATETELTLKNEAAIQGCIELLLRSRNLLLVMIAHLYQKRPNEPISLDYLAVLIGNEAREIILLKKLQGEAGSWWNHLSQMEQAQSNPPATRKTIDRENIIAISAEETPDRSAKELQKILNAMKQFTDDLEAQHYEW